MDMRKAIQTQIDLRPRLRIASLTNVMVIPLNETLESAIRESRSTEQKVDE